METESSVEVIVNWVENRSNKMPIAKNLWAGTSIFDFNASDAFDVTENSMIRDIKFQTRCLDVFHRESM